MRKKTEIRHKRIREKQVRIGKQIAKRTGRVPKLADIGKMLGYTNNPTTGIAHYWGVAEGLTQKEAIDAFYRAMGFETGRLKGRDPMSIIARREPNSIGFRLTQSRLEKGLTKEEVSLETGLSRSTITRNETGKAEPTVDSLIKYAGVYEKSLQYLAIGPSD